LDVVIVKVAQGDGCAQGYHAQVYEERPQLAESGCVQVPKICRLCGRLVAVTSWTPEAWAERQAKKGLTLFDLC
jgi:hypothetical protein